MKFSRTFFTFCGILMLTSELWKQWTLTYLLNNTVYNWWYFPFQLCSIPMYLCLILAFTQSPAIFRTSSGLQRHLSRIRPLLLTFLMDFGLLGGIFSFFDTSGMHYGYLPLTIHSYTWHLLLIVIGCYCGLCKEADHSLRGFRSCAFLYLGFCCIATVFNILFHPFGTLNMFYISPYYRMSQKVFSLIADTFGNSTGIIIYILASIFGAGLFHLMWNRLFHHFFIKKIQR